MSVSCHHFNYWCIREAELFWRRKRGTGSNTVRFGRVEVAEKTGSVSSCGDLFTFILVW